MHSKIASQETANLAESYRRLVMKLAWKTWYRLPHQTRVWISVDDIIQDGMLEANRFVIRHNRGFGRKWKGKFFTKMYQAVHNHLINEYLEKHSAQVRGWYRVNGALKPIPHNSIESMQEPVDGVPALVPTSLIVTQESIEQNMKTELFVVPTLVYIYRAASPRLQVEMVNWFWHKRTRVANKGKFKELSKEFKCMCFDAGLTCDDCIYLIRSPKCLDSLSRTLFDVPFDLNNPTPGIGNNIW